jgi:D-amino-acid dehydrogenase
MTSARTSSPHVVVVGGGVVGVSCAYYLARAGSRVTLIEREHLGAGASSGNAGTVSAGHPPLNRPGRIQQALRDMVNPASPLYVKPRWDPALWRWLLGFARTCTTAHVEHCMGVMAPLGKDALALFHELIGEERIECEYRADGYYDVCRTERGLSGARHEASIIRRYGYHPEDLDGDELRRREPALAGDILGGVFYPDAATLEPQRFLLGLAEAARRRGAVIREGVAVASLLAENGRATGVELIGGDTIRADAVVLATGPFSQRLTAQTRIRIPVQSGKGYHRDVEVGPNGAPRLRVACVLNEASVFCTPMGSRVRFAGTMEFSGENRVMRPARLRQLTAAARGAFPALGSARPVSEWCGLRPVSLDGLPIVGPLPDLEGVHVATGHGMLGLTLGPVTGDMIARAILAGGDLRLEPLSPGRFA